MYLEIVLDQQHVRLVSMYFISSCLALLKDSWMKGQKTSIVCLLSNKFEKSSTYLKKTMASGLCYVALETTKSYWNEEGCGCFFF